MSHQVILSTGSNLGNSKHHLLFALHAICNQIGEIELKSSIYESQAWGKTDQNHFLNQVLIVNTLLSPQEVLNKIQKIETAAGRKRKEHWGARTLDIDILFYDQEIIESAQLTIPHPHIENRKFILLPLYEILSDFVHPISKKTIKDLLDICKDNLWVHFYEKTT